MSTQLVLRCDGGPAIGAGHVMRCLALGQAWLRERGPVTLMAAAMGTGLRQRLEAEQIEIVTIDAAPGSTEDAAHVASFLDEGQGWIVLDGYHFDTAYQAVVRNAGRQVCVIDDTAHLDRYHADVVVNQNGNAAQLAYSVEPSTRLLLGTAYVLLRQEFLSIRDTHRPVRDDGALSLLVTLGGADPCDQTTKVIETLQARGLEKLHGDIVVGSSNPHVAEVKRALEAIEARFRLVQDAIDMPGLMAEADLAVAAGGTTCLELAFMGVPSILLVLADNQQGNAASLEEAGVCENLGCYEGVSAEDIGASLRRLAADPGARETMRNQGRVLVDGRGIERVIEALASP